ncbi:MAG: Transposase domain protein [Bryobacterales bacterium]|nr:Transposase domain protein [Bryobacterales bacterium]
MWVETASLRTSGAHPFYERLNRILDTGEFDGFAGNACRPFYSKTGRPGLAPGIYFRLLMVGYFEGIDSERGIAWRVADSLALRRFLGIELHESTPDHTTISRTRRLIDVETHRTVFGWVLKMLAEQGLMKGNTVSIDGTTLEANAALRSIVHRGTGEAYNDFLKKLAAESGIETPTREQLAKLDRKRPRKGSSEEWKSPGRSRFTDREDERRPHAPCPQSRTCGGSGDGRGSGCRSPSGNCGRHANGARNFVRSRREYLCCGCGHGGFGSQRRRSCRIGSGQEPSQ